MLDPIKTRVYTLFVVNDRSAARNASEVTGNESVPEPTGEARGRRDNGEGEDQVGEPVQDNHREAAADIEEDFNDEGDYGTVDGELSGEVLWNEEYVTHILNRLDDKCCVVDDISTFFGSLNQYSVPLVASSVPIAEHIRNCPNAVQLFVENCSKITWKREHIDGVYNMIVLYGSELPEEFRNITRNIPTITQLHAILGAIKTERLHKDGWQRAFIDLSDLSHHLNLPLRVNDTGKFRCPVALMRRQLDEYGISCIQPLRKSFVGNGSCTYSCPLDRTSMESYANTVGARGVVLIVDLYCDGVPLAKGGSQSVSPVRVLFSNMRAISTKWFDIGICPYLDVGTAKCGSTRLVDLRRELFHRYIFMVLQPLITASRTGEQYGQTFLFPRILMVVCDQKQERCTLSLRSSNSTRDFTLFDMTSRVTTAHAADYAANAERADSDGSTVSRSSSQDSFDSTRNEPPRYPTILQTQLNPDPGEERNVKRTLGAQMMIAIDRVVSSGPRNAHIVQRLRRKLPSF